MPLLNSARFISDLHLRAERPELVERFAAFLTDTASRKIEALFILGDLFEYWIGDDDLVTPFNARICRLLRQLSDSGTPIYFLAGNRDFLIGSVFAQEAGLSLLATQHVITLADTPTLLMHGDTLCTDDLSYQEFRQQVRSPEWQTAFLARSLSERRAEVEALRRQSAQAILKKPPELMDVNAAAVISAFEASSCTRLIHGHTHRPARHTCPLPTCQAERWVLSDWDTNRGDALEATADGIRRIQWV